jgi:hypothetical protein
MKLIHNCVFMQVYTNNFINNISNTLLNNKISIFINFKFPFYFCRMTKENSQPNYTLMEKHFTTLKYHNYEHYNNIIIEYFSII